MPAVVWVALLFLVGLYFLWRESLSATVASSLVVGAVNISLIVVISLLAYPPADRRTYSTRMCLSSADSRWTPRLWSWSSASFSRPIWGTCR